MNLSGIIERSAAFDPDRTAIRFEGRGIAYGAFVERIRRIAHGLKARAGVGRGDRVAVLAHNHPDTLALLYACARLGAMMVPLNWRLAPPELAFILANATPKVLVADPAFADTVARLGAALDGARVVTLGGMAGEEIAGAMPFEDLAARDGPSDNPHIDAACPLLVGYTSGTTGRPKGAVLLQEALIWNAVHSVHMHGLTAEDHVLTVLPLFHVGGLNILTTPALQAGATVTLHARFDPDACLAAIETERPTLTVQVPATLGALIDHPRFSEADLSGLRAVTTGSTIVPQHLVDAFEHRGVPVLQVYGSTETSPICVHTRLGPRAVRGPAGTTGKPAVGCEVKILDAGGREAPPGVAGEIAVKGPVVLFEYWGDEAATSEALRNGWFLTGDIGSRNADGWFFVHDRKKNLIISGGENVYPAEVERVIAEHPAVAEVAVVGMADPRWQEVPVAFVVLRPGAEVSEAALSAHVAQNLARFKVPRAVRFVAALPKNALGKVQHAVLREEVARTASRAA